MCGISGAYPLNVKGLELDEQLRKEIIMYIHNEMLLETVVRGKDATGICVSFGPGPDETVPFWCVLKQPVDTSDFFVNDGTQTRYKGQDPDANIHEFMDASMSLTHRFHHVTGHTRAGTVGSEYNPLNNHPILVGNIIGVHNGGVKNADKIYTKHNEMTRLGEVDSEAIFQLFAEVANDHEITKDDINYVCKRIEGARSVIVFNRLFPSKIGFFHDKDRPLELAFVPELGAAFITSEKKFLHAAMHAYTRNRLTLGANLPELTYGFRNVPDNQGGILDIDQEYEPDTKLEEMFPLFLTDKLERDYEKSYSSTTSSTSATAPYTKWTPQGTGKTVHGTTNAVKKAAEKATSSTTKPVPAALEDLSDYSKETGKSVTASVHTVNASAVMDDNDTTDTAEGERPDVSAADVSPAENVADLYTDEELRNRGSAWAFGETAKDDKTLYINRHDGKFDQALSVGINNEEATEIVHQIYPEIFSEGFAIGFREGASEQADSFEDAPDYDATKDKLEELAVENAKLKKLLLEERTNQRKASGFIANTKAILMAMFVNHGGASVVTDSMGNLSLEFSEEMKEFIATTAGFKRCKLKMLAKTFNYGDLKALATMISGKMEDSEEGIDTGVMPSSEATNKAKNIKY